MSRIADLLKANKKSELWDLCCGFIDLNTEQFIQIQEQLLLEQLELLKRCKLGRKIMRGAMPATVEEFRKSVPITTYSDYCPELLERDEDVLPVKPVRWIQTSGRSGEYPFKWIPATERFWEEAGLDFCAIAIFSTCNGRKDFPLRYGYKILHSAAQSPCLTGHIAHKLGEELGFQFMPPLDESEQTAFEARVSKGLKIAIADGMEGFFGLAGILVAIGEKFKKGSSGHISVSKLLANPGMLMRMLRGKIKSKLAGRIMLPKDLWKLNGIVSMGTDSLIYKNKIKEIWGRAPLDAYGNSESTVIATQTWDYSSMVLFPNLNFLEFIPEEEHIKWQSDKKYTPKTVLLNEVKAGENYELVITNLHGGVLIRYRLGDMIRITSLKNEKLGISLPQIVFERRADDLIDLGFVRLTERTIWQALENSGIPYTGWTARKEINANKSTLHLYVELQEDSNLTGEEIARLVYEQIKQIDDGLYVYKDINNLEQLIDFKPIKVTVLPAGVFADYKVRRQAEGSSLAHLRPPHINPSDKILEQLNMTSEAEINSHGIAAGTKIKTS
jgi:hypothetical protein